MSLTSAKKLLIQGVGIDDDARAIAARMSPAPSSERFRLINYTVVQLKRRGLWAKLDAFYLFAAHALQPALLNWRQNRFNASIIRQGSGIDVTFVADRYIRTFGDNGDVINNAAGINLNFDPRTEVDQPKLFAMSNAHASEWTTTHNFALVNVGNSTASIYLTSTAGFSLNGARVSASGNDFPNPVFDSPCGLTRTNSGEFTMVNNDTVATRPSAVGTYPGSANPTTISFGRNMSADARAASLGGGLTVAEMKTLHAIQRNYLSKIGAVA